MNKENALFVGRFQPFHLGHLSVVKQIESVPDVEKILIGIGSSQEANTEVNPFGFSERAQMITDTLKNKLQKPFAVFGIPDVHNDEKWQKLLDILSPEKFSIVYTGNDWVKRILEKNGVEIRRPEYEYLVCASEVRELMKTGQEWQDLVPEEVISLIKNIRGVERIRGRYGERLSPNVTADIIINYRDEGIVLIQRKEKAGDPNSLKWAVPGGHIDYGQETVEGAAIREAKEETNLDISITPEDQFRQYSDPDRDPRGHYVTMVYHTRVDHGELKAGDDAVDIKVFPWDQIPDDMGFDHNRFLKDYIGKRRLQI